VVGAPGAGKTSIIRRYVAGSYSKAYKATVGVDFALKVVSVNANTKVYLQLWDIAGQERFGTMTPIYYKKAVGALVVFDLNEIKTFQAVPNWVNDIKEKLKPDNSDIPILLLGNKIDLLKEGFKSAPIQQEQIQDVVSKYKFIGYTPTSAKDNINITEAIDQLLDAVLESIQNESVEDPDVVTLTTDKPSGSNAVHSDFCGCGGGDKID